MGLLGLVRSPWAVLAFVVCAIGSMAWAYGSGKSNGVAQERAAQAEAMAIAIEQSRVAHEAQLRERGWQDSIEAAASRATRVALQERLAELAAMPSKVLIKTKVVRDENGCDCPVPSLGDDFWLHYRAARGQRGAADPVPAAAVPDRM